MELRNITALLLTSLFSLSLVTTGCMCQMGGHDFFSHLLMIGMNCTCMMPDGIDDIGEMASDETCCMMNESDSDHHHHDRPTLIERHDINFFYTSRLELSTKKNVVRRKNNLPFYQAKQFKEPVLPIFIPPKICV